MSIKHAFDALEAIGEKTYLARNGEEELYFRGERIGLELYSGFFGVSDPVLFVDDVRCHYSKSPLLTDSEKARITDILRAKTSEEVKCASLEQLLAEIFLRDGRVNEERIDEESLRLARQAAEHEAQTHICRSAKRTYTEALVKAIVETILTLVSGIAILVVSLVRPDAFDPVILRFVRVISVALILVIPLLWRFAFLPMLTRYAAYARSVQETCTCDLPSAEQSPDMAGCQADDGTKEDTDHMSINHRRQI